MSSISPEVLFIATISLWFINRWSNSKKMKRNLSQEEEDNPSVLELPYIELSLFLNRDKLNEADMIKECKKVAEGLHEYSCIIVRDPRVSATDNDDFLDMMERFV
jgi:hypothetical protein